MNVRIFCSRLVLDLWPTFINLHKKESRKDKNQTYCITVEDSVSHGHFQGGRGHSVLKLQIHSILPKNGGTQIFKIFMPNDR